VKKVFVSGCFDILHAGHIQFFKDAKALGDYLIVSFASDAVLKKYKNRVSALPEAHKKAVLESLKMVDEVVVGNNLDDPILDFKEHFLRIKPDILALCSDDKFVEKKKELCKLVGTELFILSKNPPAFTPISTTEIRERILKSNNF
jgi:cytidyltransferase-like protein